MLSDTEIYFPPIGRGIKLPQMASKENEMEKVYCEECKYSRWAESFFPEYGIYACKKEDLGWIMVDGSRKNANHDCKDFEPKDAELEK